MRPNEPAERAIGEGYRYVGLGCTFAGGIVLFMAAGWGLDRWLGFTPWLTIVGTLVGAVLSFLNVYWRLQAEAEAEARRRDREKR